MRAALLLALVMVTPLSGAQSVGGMAAPPEDTGYAGGTIVVPLHGHIYDLLQPVPINTQPMQGEDLARGFGSPTVTGAGPLATPNFLRFYSSPGLVEYNLTQDGVPRTHPERGLSYDALLDASKLIVGHWFMGVKALDVPQAGQTGGPEAGLAPALTVRMTMRMGDDIGADLDAGDIIAQGQTTLDPSAWPANGAPLEFVVDMGTPRVDRIEGNESFNVKVEWFNAETPDGRQATQRDWILHTGPAHPNRVEVSITNPLALYSLRPTPVGEDLLTIHALLNSPWGNYDVDTSTIELDVRGPSTPTNIPPPFVVQRSFEHNHHYEPVQVTWAWNYREDGAKPGEYEIEVRAWNLQRTAMVSKSATFTIPEGGRVVGYSDTGDVVQAEGVVEERPTPGLLLAAPLALVGAALLARRR